MLQRAYDVLGNVALVNFHEKLRRVEKKKFAEQVLKTNGCVKTVLEKTGNFSGKLRTMKTRYLAGERTKEVLYKENGCVFRFNIDKSYFSSRLSNERKEISSLIKKGEKVLVMFAGVGPFSISIARNSKAGIVYSNELNRNANKYAEMNLDLNKVKKKIKLIPGNIKKVAQKINEKFDVIVMPRPQLKNSFLEQAFKLSKKGTRIYYYDFCLEEEKEKIVEKIKQEAKQFGKKVRVLKTKKAGEVAPYKIRFRVDFKVI